MNKRKINGLNDFIAALGGYCDDGLSGTVYFNSDENGSARLVLETGRIISVTYKHLSGMDAIDELKTITIGQLSFISGMVLKSGTAQVLPDSDNLLRMLAKGPPVSSKSNDSEVIIPALPIPKQDSIEEIEDYSRDLVIKVLTEESVEFLGPIASRLCERYLPDSGRDLSLTEVNLAMKQLARDITDKAYKVQFLIAAKSRLGIR